MAGFMIHLAIGKRYIEKQHADKLKQQYANKTR